MFFSFEGIDGSGKSTQARLLSSALRQRGYDVIDVREPGGTDLGEQVRSLLLDPGGRVDPRAELLLFSAARAQLVAHVIEPALARGAVVVADRFFDSSTAYQGGGRGVADLTWLSSLHAFATAGRAPDRTYLIDVDVETAETRRGEAEPDRMETSGDAFYASVRESYLQLTRSTPGRIVTVDGQGTIESMHATILNDALAILESD